MSQRIDLVNSLKLSRYFTSVRLRYIGAAAKAALLVLVGLLGCNDGGGVADNELQTTLTTTCSESLIFNGTECTHSTIPVVRLHFSAVAGSSVCTGSIGKNGIILTAAHCFDETLGLPVVEFSDGSFVSPSSADILDQYLIEPGPAYDIAFIRVSSEEASNRGISPALLADSRNPPVVGTTITVVGFGLDRTGELPNFPRTAQMFVNEASRTGTFIAGPLVTKPGAGTTCPGDSGAPAFVVSEDRRWELIGVVSEGKDSSACDSDSQTIFSDLSGPEVRQALDSMFK